MRVLKFGLALALALGAGGAWARTVLTIVDMRTGAVTEMTRANIEALPQAELTTSNRYVEGAKVFRGPLAREVFAAAGIEDGDVAVMTAANDYAVEIPFEDFLRYDVVLAGSMDGKRLSLRDKGPYWVMYPIDQHKELTDEFIDMRLIWQLVRIEVK